VEIHRKAAPNRLPALAALVAAPQGRFKKQYKRNKRHKLPRLTLGQCTGVNRRTRPAYRKQRQLRLFSRHGRRKMLDRRQVLAFLAGVMATPALAQSGLSRMTAYAFSFAGLKGHDIKLADFAGKPILVVNTASQCGYTPQYAGLQQLWTR